MLNPPKPAMPPLNALRAFEAAARLGGFKAAAAELAVTPGAVAQHVKALEAWAGAALFERMSHGVRLTELGETVIADFSSAFDRLGEAVLKLREIAGPATVRIAVLPSIAQLWLSARLPALRRIDPRTTISISALDQPPNLSREPYDLSIFFKPADAEFDGAVICRDELFPVCAPPLAAMLGEPADLAGMLFLHDDSLTGDWQKWLEYAAPGERINTAGPTFSLYSLALQEVQNEAGIMIGHEPLVRAGIRDGSLVAPFPQKLAIPVNLVVETPSPARPGSLIARIIEVLRVD
jgi:LysR family glycine cleavage system transcriptional activator